MSMWSIVVLAVLSQSPAAAPSKDAPEAFRPTVTPYGYVNFQYALTDPPGDRPDVHTFEFRRVRIGLKGEITPQIGFAVLYDGADNAMKDVYASVKALPGVELRLGQFKTPFGYEQPESDSRLLWLYNSYVVAALARGRDSRDLGVLAIGKWKLVEAFSAELSAAVVNGAGSNVRDDLGEKNVWTRGGLSWSQSKLTARLGASYGYGRQVATLGTDNKFGVQGGALDDTYFFFHTVGADLSFDSPWFFAVAEYMQSNRRAHRYSPTGPRTASDLQPTGWYVAGYGKTPWNAGPIVRAEAAHLPVSSGAEAGTALNAGWNQKYTVGAYYDVTPINARFVLNYEFDASDEALRTGNRFIAYVQVAY